MNIRLLNSYLNNASFVELPLSGKGRYLGGIVGGYAPSRYAQSPHLWREYFHKHDLPHRYEAFDINWPDDDVGQRDALRRFDAFLKAVIESGIFYELTITNPYKERAFRFLASYPECTLDSPAMHAKAVNHVVFRDSEIFAYNTDGSAMCECIVSQVAGRVPKSCLILGAGGAGRAIACALLQASELVLESVHVYDPNHAKAQCFGERILGYVWGKLLQIVSAQMVAERLVEQDIIVAAYTGDNAFLLEHIDRVQASAYVFDTRYDSSSLSAEPIIADVLGSRLFDGQEMLEKQFLHILPHISFDSVG